MKPCELKRFKLPPNQKFPPPFRFFEKATSDPDELCEMWTEPVSGDTSPHNAGVLTGDGIFVPDVDVKNGRKGRESLRELVGQGLIPLNTYCVRTPSGGLHIYLKSPPGVVVRNRVDWMPGIDIRGHHGYVAGVGSIVDGQPYTETTLQEWLDGRPALRVVGSAAAAVEIMEAPGELLALLPRATLDAVRADIPLVDLDQPGAIAAATDWLKRSAPEAIEGNGGDATTYKNACRVKDFGISEGVCLDLMLEHWNDIKAFPPWEPGDLEKKVANAYGYGKLPVGVISPEADFSEPEQGKAKRLRHALTAEEWRLAKRPIDYLIDRLLSCDTTVVVFGDTSIGKSLVLLDIALHIVLGIPWRGRAVMQGLVVYIAAEGGRGMALRTYAWLRKHGRPEAPEEIPFGLVPYRFNMLDKKEQDELCRIVREQEQRFGQPVRMIVLDTLARTMVGDEWRDMGAYVAAMDRFRAEFPGVTPATIHHTGKDKSRGSRGGYQLKCDVDIEIEIQPGRILNSKMRDDERQDALYFGIEKVEIDMVDGKQIHAGVAVERSSADMDFTLPAGEAEKALDGEGVAWMADVRAAMGRIPDRTHVTPEMMAVFWGISNDAARKRLRILRKKGVLYRPEPGKYVLIGVNYETTEIEDDE